jgi:RNA-directed DNA polymerase
VVRGFFAYHAVPTNGSALRAFYYYVKRIWLRTLRRRPEGPLLVATNARISR